MTNQPTSNPSPRAAAPRPSLYRYVVSLGIAAIVATWLPFSFLYVNALNSRPAAVIGAPVSQAVGALPAHATALTPVTTRTS